MIDLDFVERRNKVQKEDERRDLVNGVGAKHCRIYLPNSLLLNHDDCWSETCFERN